MNNITGSINLYNPGLFERLNTENETTDKPFVQRDLWNCERNVKKTV